MGYELIIGAGILLLVGVFIYSKMLAQKLESEGKIIKRPNDYLKQDHLFSTKISDIEQIFQKLNQAVLKEHNISIETDFSEGIIIFRNHGLAGSFVAVLEMEVSEASELSKYHFYIYSIIERDSGYSRSDVLGGNIVLTTIEKAILQLDKEVKVERTYMKYQSKTSFF